jgi:hypothetical protein
MMRSASRVITRSMTVLLLAGCSSSAMREHPVAPLDADARNAIGPLSVETAMVDPVAPAAPPPTRNRGAAALKGAGQSVLFGMAGGAQLNDAFGFILFSALGVVAAPFVAAGAAIAAPVSTEVQEADAGIRGAVSNIQWNLALKDAVAKALANQGRTVADAPTADASRLKLTVEGPWLVVESYTALPTLTVHGELAKRGACLMDRRWRWNGRSDDFVYLGEDRATPYRAQMEEGLAILAEAVVADILVSAEPRKIAYRDEDNAARGGLPLLVTRPMDFQKQVASWDKTDVEAAREPRCGGVEPIDPALGAPSAAEACRGFGCRNL